MKNSKLVFALSFLFTLCFSGIQAQSKTKIGNEQKEAIVSQHKADKERLALTKEQEAPFMEITKKFMLKLKEVRDSDADRREKFKTLKDLQSQKNGEMKAFLSESQYATYIEIQKERRAKIQERRNQ